VIYLDHNATTPIAPDVLEAMMPYLTAEWGNPSSTYRFGARLKGVIETAREQVAELLRASASEIIFTSCATESNNAALQAALQATGKRHTAGVHRDPAPSQPLRHIRRRTALALLCPPTLLRD
jgi:cysteine desulfurase